MATIVALDCTDGVLLAGDRAVVQNGMDVGSQRHVFGFDFDGVDVGAAAIGADPDSFRRRLDVALREYAADRGVPGIDAVARLASEIVGETGVEAFVAARGDDGWARIRSVVDGVYEERVTALGSATSLVLGQLDAFDEVPLDEAESRIRRAFRAAASRDPGTGEEIDVWRLADAEGVG